MKPTILLFNFTDKSRLDKLIKAILPLKIRTKKVNKEEYLQPIGSLIGIKDINVIEEKYSGPELEYEMLLMADLTKSQFEQLFFSLNKAGLKIPLKAVLTETNQYWNTLQLNEELKKEKDMLIKTL